MKFEKIQCSKPWHSCCDTFFQNKTNFFFYGIGSAIAEESSTWVLIPLIVKKVWLWWLFESHYGLLSMYLTLRRELPYTITCCVMMMLHIFMMSTQLNEKYDAKPIPSVRWLGWRVNGRYGLVSTPTNGDACTIYPRAGRMSPACAPISPHDRERERSSQKQSDKTNEIRFPERLWYHTFSNSFIRSHHSYYYESKKAFQEACESRRCSIPHI